jgi:hypothetical protein
MRTLDTFQRILEPLPIRGKGRLAEVLLARHRSAELSSRPLPGVRVFLRASERIERLMWAGAYERDLVELFKRSVRPGMTVLDVGANIGYFSTIAAGLVGSHGRVHAFEPVPSCFARLERNLSQFGWAWAHRSAVGDKSGVATVHFKESESGWGSLKRDAIQPAIYPVLNIPLAFPGMDRMRKAPATAAIIIAARPAEKEPVRVSK